MHIALISFENELNWGLRSITEYLRKHDFNVTLYFLEKYQNVFYGIPEKTIDSFINHFQPNPDTIIGLSFTTPYKDIAFKLSDRLRTSGAITISGGIHATIAAQECGAHFDYVIRGMGEDALLELVTSLNNKQIPPKGIYKKPDDYWFIEDVGKYPFPHYDQVKDIYILNGKIKSMFSIPRKVWFVTRYTTYLSFGCVYECSYCVNPILHQLSNRRGKNFLRTRPISLIMDELIEIRRKVDTISFEEEDIFLNGEQRTLDFFKLYKEEIGLPYVCQVTPHSINFNSLENIVRTMKKTGCITITSGIQSVSPRTCGIFNRRFDKEKFLTIAKAFSKYNLIANYDIILGNPFEDDSDIEHTMNFIFELPHPFCINLYYLTFFSGYKITQKAIEAGFKTEFESDTRRHIRSITLEERLIRMAEIYMFPRKFLKNLYSTKHKKSTAFIINLFGALSAFILKLKIVQIYRIAIYNPLLPFKVILHKFGLK